MKKLSLLHHFTLQKCTSARNFFGVGFFLLVFHDFAEILKYTIYTFIMCSDIIFLHMNYVILFLLVNYFYVFIYVKYVCVKKLKNLISFPPSLIVPKD